jgi:chromosomal replication initiation ATPase DnaA
METNFENTSVAYIIPGLEPALTDIQIVTKKVAEYYGISTSSLKLKSRKRELVEPRQVVMFIGRNCLQLNWIECGVLFGVDHSTAIYGSKVVAGLCVTNRSFREKMREILSLVGTDEKKINTLLS